MYLYCHHHPFCDDLRKEKHMRARMKVPKNVTQPAKYRSIFRSFWRKKYFYVTCSKVLQISFTRNLTFIENRLNAEEARVALCNFTLPLRLTGAVYSIHLESKIKRQNFTFAAECVNKQVRLTPSINSWKRILKVV